MGDPLAHFFADEPAVGFAIVDLHGVVRFINERSADIFLDGRPEDALGRVVSDLFEREWVEERMQVFHDMLDHGRPVVFRHILRGRRVQSTLRLLPVEEGEPPSLSIVTVEGELEPPPEKGFAVIESAFADFGPLSSLSRRELEVLSLLGHGMTSAQIAEALFRSPRTIEKHLDALRSKLGNSNRVQLASYARAAGLRLKDADLRRTTARSGDDGSDTDPRKPNRP
ncbi:MAG: LuxR C-terminal-related transcriptional regulator [Planctomycetota bacterium]